MSGKKPRGKTAKQRRQAQTLKYRLVLLAVIFFISAVLFVTKAGFSGLDRPETVSEAAPEVSRSGPQSEPAETILPAAPSAPSVRTVPAAEPQKAPVASTAKPPAAKPSGSTPVQAAPKPAAVPEKPVPPKAKGTLIFVFDDAGHNLKQLEPFLKLPFPVTIAVLPGLEYSKKAAERARAAGKEVILHQPMQAINLSFDPGPGAIRQGMNGDEIRAIVRKNLDEVGPVSGLNNHEGSLITSDPAAMGAVLDVVRERGIYFLDSRTIANTAAPAVARERNMDIWERAVFLDNIQERESIIEAVTSGMKVAERKGAAIMIGHIWSNDLAEILAEMYPELVSEGFSLSTIAHIAIHDEENR